MEVMYMEIERTIKEARLNSGLTQEQAAENLMVSRQTISNWENGKSLPDIVSVMNMSDLYQISLDELLKGDQKMKEKMVKDLDAAEGNKRLILTAAVLFLAVAVIYGISIYVGGDFYDFCKAAIAWVILGISLAFAGTYMSQKEK
jgi:transcriptional regulator with XRE-family HTH domain